ncbi:MAG: type II secretion system protein [Candidatus Doudnabacteria bacterium]
MRKIFRSRGFTLVELLVVIAIIGILASVVMVSLNPARAKARDAQRKSDLTNFSLALEMYYDSQTTPSYPTTAQGLAVLAPTYMPRIPADPGGHTYTYIGCNAIVTKAANGSCNACGTACAAPPCSNYCMHAILDNDTTYFGKP